MYNSINKGIMKREFTRKSILVLAAIVVSMGLFAQIPSDYTSISGDNTVAIDSVTVGSTTPYYVAPDSYYHPDYAGLGTLTAGFTWTWLVTPAAGTSMSATNNYVEIDWNAAGLFNVTVNEQAPASLGGCAGPDTNMYVRVIAEPSVTYTANNPNTIIGTDISVCENDPQLAGIVQAAITSVAGTSPTVQLQYTFRIDTVHQDAGSGQFSLDEYLGSASSQITSINAATYNLDKPAAGYVALDESGSGKKQTVYTYTINGVNDRISRKSDYMNNSAKAADAWSWYDTTVETIVITVNPAPTTGPIYHISNDWAN
jgi:hypothetical protein